MKSTLLFGVLAPMLLACAGASVIDDDAGEAADSRLADSNSDRDVARGDTSPAGDTSVDDASAMGRSNAEAADVVDADAIRTADADADAGVSALRDADPPMPSVRVASGATTDAELVDRLPIGTSSSGATRRVVLRLSPSDLPSLQSDDVLMAPAEVEVTTACDIGQTGPMCGYSPNVAAQIVLTGNRDDVDPSGTGSHALSAVQTMSVTSADHHALFTFRAAATRSALSGAFDLPCMRDQSCYVNVVMWAWDAAARPGGADVLLVGSNEGDFLQNGRIDGDAARLMAIRERRITAADRDERETSGSSSVTLPLDATPVLVYSHQLTAGSGDLRAGEQFYVEGRMVVAVSGRARFSSQMFLSRDPRATDARSFDAIEPSSISEHNGINCTAGTSPCTTNKVGVFRVTRDIGGPVYLQIAARSAVPGGGSASVRVDRNAGWLRSTRYAASLQ